MMGEVRGIGIVRGCAGGGFDLICSAIAVDVLVKLVVSLFDIISNDVREHKLVLSLVTCCLLFWPIQA